MPERLCQRPGCGNAIPSHKRRDARWCSRRCESKARRAAARKARFEVANPGSAELLGAENQSLAELYDHAAHQGDDDADRRTPEQRAQDERYAAMIAGDESAAGPAQRPAERPIDGLTAGHVQSRFDVTTAGAVASNGAASRGLNRRPVARPVRTSQSFDFRANGGQSGQRSRHADYRWAGLDDGFTF